jgi:hypothetical protein
MIRNIQLAAACAVVLFMAQQSQAHPFVVDQSNAVGGGGGGVGYGPVSVLVSGGQSFTPALTSIDVAEFDLRSDGSTDVLVKLYDGVGFGGLLLGTSASQTIALGGVGDFTTYHFDFPSTIALTPGNPYLLQVEYVSGDDAFIDYGESDPYLGGDALDLSGAPAPGFDMVFSEGPAVPEPSTFALIGVAAVIGVGVALRRRRAK